MNMACKRWMLGLLTTCMLPVIGLSQEKMLLHTLPAIPQSHLSNPAYIPPYGGHFSLLIPGIGVSVAHSGFAWEDLVSIRADDSLALDLGQAIGQMKALNHLHSSLWIEPFSLGFRFGKNYLSTAASLRYDIRFQYPKDLFNLLYQGNAAYIGEEIVLDDTGMSGALWMEQALGYSRVVNDRLSIGLRLKYLNGLAGIHMAENHLRLHTDADMYDLTLSSEFTLHTSVPGLDDEEFEFPRNRGFGLDLGATYQVMDGLVLVAGVNDLGRIHWEKNLSSIRSSGATQFTFSGLNLDNLFGDGNGDDFEAIVDSLANLVSTESFETTFSTSLPTTAHLGGSYRLLPGGQASAFLYLSFFENHITPSFSLSYSQRLGRVLSLATNLAYRDHSINNLGVGLALNLGPLQIYAISSNVLSITRPHIARNTGVQFGLNFLIGWRDPARWGQPAITQTTI